MLLLPDQPPKAAPSIFELLEGEDSEVVPYKPWRRRPRCLRQSPNATCYGSVGSSQFEGPPKVAFLFLTRWNLPLDVLWGCFFENADVGNFSIYIHSEPGFVFDESTTRSAFFYNRQLTNMIKVAWGEASMIQAERLLLGAALEDPANQRFVLLSDSKGLMEVLRSWGGGGGQMGKRCCKAWALAPLCLMWLLWLERNLRVFQGVVRSASCLEDRFLRVLCGWVTGSVDPDFFLDEKEGRYNPTMSPVIPKNKWRKGSQSVIVVAVSEEKILTFEDIIYVFFSDLKLIMYFQWVSLVRGHAEIVVDDEVIFPVFKKFCKRRPPLDASKGKQNIKLQKQHNCIPDEHYVQTLLAMSDLEGELERRTVTYTLWNHSATNMERKGWHPITFSYANAGPQQIKRIKDITQVYYETEQRTEWCSNNSTHVPCFLFGRKFSKGAAVRLVSEGVVGPFNASVLLETPL
ncbi:unnamed protein product [Camellia sinensis]